MGDTEYLGESEGEVHCHGFVWPEDANDAYILVLAQWRISTTGTRGATTESECIDVFSFPAHGKVSMSCVRTRCVYRLLLYSLRF